MKIVAVIQARMGSTRFPGKVMKLICGVPMINMLLDRLSHSQEVDEIIVATTNKPDDIALKEYVSKLGYPCFAGSENDLIERYLQAAQLLNADVIVRITGDCPFVDPALVDKVILRFKEESADYASNISPATYPDGLDVEVFTLQALQRAYYETDVVFDREHVTPYIRNSGKFKQISVLNDKDLSHLRWTVDEECDFHVVSKVFEYFKPNIYFGWKDILELQQIKPDIFQSNQHLIRNEGAMMGSGQKLWKRAKKKIAGGNMLLSKRPEMFLPDRWPAYYEKAKGCRVWDLDGNEYIDMSIMGVGTNILGYGHPEVDEVVRKTLEKGNMSTLNCPEEVYLAEKLIELHPWADMARFARSGGEANAISIRIARAATNNSKIAICGYHGWHDWYLAANLGSTENLSGHLLPGLNPNGVPSDLRNTIFPFNYNNFSELETLVSQEDIGIIKMEVCRNQQPEDNFLQKVRDLATKKGIILIFDECTSGFRQSFGGLHKIYNVEPDMAIFGKTLGNGYAITAVLGKRDIMEAAQSTFISSTFWTERLGPSAALKVLEVMERLKSWDIITNIGREIGERWERLAKKFDLSINVSGLPALISFAFNSPKNLHYKTFITQEMLKKGFLASNSVYTCIEHTKEVIDSYFYELEKIFEIIKKCEEGLDINSLLEGPVCQSGFKRLN
jgi:glutamate-1-semialdehyde 2,1-aminomutase